MSEEKAKGSEGFEIISPTAGGNGSQDKTELEAMDAVAAEATARAEAAEKAAAEAIARAEAAEKAAGKQPSKGRKTRTKGGKIKCVKHPLHHPYLDIRIPTTHFVPIDKWDNWVQVQIESGLIIEEK